MTSTPASSRRARDQRTGTQGDPHGLGRPRHRGDRAGIAFRTRTCCSWWRAGLRRGLVGQLPGAHPVDVLEGPDHPRCAVGRHRRPGVVGGPVILSPTVWVKIFGNKAAIFPYDHPAIVSMMAFFVTGCCRSPTRASVRRGKPRPSRAVHPGPDRPRLPQAPAPESPLRGGCRVACATAATAYLRGAFGPLSRRPAGEPPP